jgi:hypothetical protein
MTHRVFEIPEFHEFVGALGVGPELDEVQQVYGSLLRQTIKHFSSPSILPVNRSTSTGPRVRRLSWRHFAKEPSRLGSCHSTKDVSNLSSISVPTPKEANFNSRSCRLSE